MPHVLFISSAIPPFAESQTIRNVFFLRSLASAGYQLTILTMGNASGDTSLTALLPECDLIRTDISRYDRVLRFLGRLPFCKQLQWLYGIYANYFIVPDSRAGWDRIIVSHLEHNPLKAKPDVIISASGSYTAHIAASELGKKYNVPYVAELGDPWTFNPIWPANFFYRIWRNRRIESKVIPSAKALIVTTEQTAKLYRNWLSCLSKRVHVATMGYSQSEFSDISLKEQSASLKITYVGVAYRTGRNLVPTIDALTSISKEASIEFQIVGPHSKAFERYAFKRKLNFIKFKGRVSYSNSINIIKNADILLVVGNSGGLQVPGKIFMYLASGRPILLISQDYEASDPSWQILKDFPGTKFCTNNPIEICNALQDMTKNIASWHQLGINRLSMPKLQTYEWNSIGAQFVKVVNKCIKDTE